MSPDATAGYDGKAVNDGEKMSWKSILAALTVSTWITY